MPEPTTPAAWYADPVDASRWRYWDGYAWTEHLRSAPVASPVPVVAETASVAAGAAVAVAAVGRHASPPQAQPPRSHARTPREQVPEGRAGSRHRSPRRRFLTRPLVWVLALLLGGALWAGWETSRAPTDTPPVVMVPQSSPTPSAS